LRYQKIFWPFIVPVRSLLFVALAPSCSLTAVWCWCVQAVIFLVLLAAFDAQVCIVRSSLPCHSPCCASQSASNMDASAPTRLSARTLSALFAPLLLLCGTLLARALWRGLSNCSRHVGWVRHERMQMQHEQADWEALKRRRAQRAARLAAEEGDGGPVRVRDFLQNRRDACPTLRLCRPRRRLLPAWCNRECSSRSLIRAKAVHFA
jgi:hypothetical protein